jgi:hypothetical protein
LASRLAVHIVAAAEPAGPHANGLRIADAAAIDCKIGEARFACTTPQWGYPAGDLVIWDALGFLGPGHRAMERYGSV